MKNPFEDLGTRKQEQKEEHPEIPLFDKLSPRDKKFVLKVKGLSEMTEEEFLNKRGVKSKEKLKPFEGDEENKWIATMYELVLLHLLELQDSLGQIELKQKGEIPVGAKTFSSPKTCYLIKNITDRILLLDSLPMPDDYTASELSIKFSAKSEDVNERLKAIHKLLNIIHRYNTTPAISGLIKDIWRWWFSYGGLRGFTSSLLENKSVAQYRKEKEFFEKLGNLGNDLIKGGGQS